MTRASLGFQFVRSTPRGRCNPSGDVSVYQRWGLRQPLDSQFDGLVARRLSSSRAESTLLTVREGGPNLPAEFNCLALVPPDTGVHSPLPVSIEVNDQLSTVLLPGTSQGGLDSLAAMTRDFGLNQLIEISALTGLAPAFPSSGDSDVC